jgi:hypothetical protein
VFLVGCPRSGTTLLQRLLDAHSEVAVAPETHLVRNFWKRRRDYGELADDRNFGRLLDDIVNLPWFGALGQEAGPFREAALSGTRSLAAPFALLFERFAADRGAKWVGEKTPNHLLYMRTLERLFPDCRFLQIVRDPRAVATSWRALPWSNGSLQKDAEVWRKYQARARALPPRDQDRLLTIRYERLVAEPVPVLTGVCAFLGLPFESRMLEFHRSVDPGLDLSREPWKQQATHPLSAERADRFRQELTDAEIRKIEAVTWFEMRRAAYPPDSALLKALPGVLAAASLRRLTALWRRLRKLARQTRGRWTRERRA